jgi:hypothetical protein
MMLVHHPSVVLDGTDGFTLVRENLALLTDLLSTHVVICT